MTRMEASAFAPTRSSPIEGARSHAGGRDESVATSLPVSAKRPVTIGTKSEVGTVSAVFTTT